MPSRYLASTLIIAISLPSAALAQESGFFAGIDLSAGAAFGTSQTRDGGALWSGGGIVDNVSFGAMTGVGVHAGYRFNPILSASVSAAALRGDVRWKASFPLWGVASGFQGAAVSTVVLGNLTADLPLGEATTLRAGAGLGLALNSLANVVESDIGTGVFVSDVAERLRIDPAARISLGITQKITANAQLGLDTGLTYVGGFETGTTRTGNMGVAEIKPYRIDDVWRADINASLRISF